MSKRDIDMWFHKTNSVFRRISAGDGSDYKWLLFVAYIGLDCCKGKGPTKVDDPLK